MSSWEWEVFRRKGLVFLDSPAPEGVPDEISEPAAEHCAVEYEPRSLALGKGARQIAVGTKSGRVYWLQLPMEDEEKPTPTEVPHSVRALCFLSDDHLLAGHGAGNVSVIGNSGRRLTVSADAAGGWSDRFRGLTKLHPDLVLVDDDARRFRLRGGYVRRGGTKVRFPKGTANGSVALGRLESASHACVVQLDGGRIECRRTPVDELCEDIEMGCHLLGLTWSHGRLWGLMMKGHRNFVYCFRPLAPGRVRAGQILKCLGKFEVGGSTGGAPWRSITSCVAGLLLRSAGEIGFVPYPFCRGGQPVLGGSDDDMDELVEQLQSYYRGRFSPSVIRIPGLFDAAVTIAHASRREEHGWERTLKAEQGFVQVRVAVASSSVGLGFATYTLRAPEGATGTWLKPKVRRRRPARFIPHTAQPILLRFASTEDGKLRLVTCFRENLLTCAPVANYPALRDRIHGNALPPPNDDPRAGTRLFADLYRRIRSCAPPSDDEELDVSGLEGGDLLWLAKEVVRGTRRVDSDPWPEDARYTFLVGWCQRLLQLAAAYPDLTPAELGAALNDAMDRFPLKGMQDRESLERRLSNLSGFIRKWFSYGYTYSLREDKLTEVIQWNRETRNHLDALAYLAVLLQHRVDVRWSTRHEPDGDAAWAIATASSDRGRVVVCAGRDGGIRAFDDGGAALSWRGVGEECGLKAEGNVLRNEDNATFRETYHHGRYTRSLVFETVLVDGAKRFLLVFSARGLRPSVRTPDTDSHHIANPQPYLCALLVEHGVDGLYVVRQARHDSPQRREVYGLGNLELGEGDPTRATVGFGYGFPIFSQQNGEQGFRAGLFGLLQLDWSGGTLTMETEEVDFIDADPQIRQGPSAIEAHDFNPTWSLVCTRRPDGSVMVVSGSQEGWIRVHEPAPQRAVTLRRIKGSFRCEGPVWHLCVVKADPLTIAYGTGSGVIGILAWTEEGQWQHLMHSWERDPISGITLVHQENGTDLLATSFTGKCVLYRADCTPDEAGRSLPFKRVDRFTLPFGVRSISLAGRRTLRLSTREDDGAWCHPGDVPLVVCGTHDGTLRCFAVAFPRQATRTRAVRGLLRERVSAEGGEGEAEHFLEWAEGDEPGAGTQALVDVLADPHGGASHAADAYRLLRVIPLGSQQMMRLSLWRELKHQGDLAIRCFQRAENPSDVFAALERLEEFRMRLLVRANELFRRRPMHSPPIKMLWSVAARVSNLVAESLVQAYSKAPWWLTEGQTSSFERWAHAHTDLTGTIDDLCNRWIGVGRSQEVKVLAHTFLHLFDPTDVWLIGFDDSGLDRAREVLYHMVRRRLTFTDKLSPLETLRVLNSALYGFLVRPRFAVVRRSRRFVIQIPYDRPEVWSPTPKRKHVPFDMHGLMTLVGNAAARNQASLSAADPLCTHLGVFFALCVLLFPQSSLVVAHVISESGLGPGRRAVERSMLQALRRLGTDLPDEPGRDLDDIIKVLRAFWNPEVSLLDGSDLLTPWRELQEHDRQPDPRHAWTDHDLLLELSWIIERLSAMANPSGPLPTGEMPAWRFFGEVQVHIETLAGLRTQFGQRYRQPQQDERAEARRIVDEALAGLEDDHSKVSVPCRWYLREVVQSWKNQLQERQREALDVLDEIESFHRHSHRRSVDALFFALTELAMQEAPMLPETRWGGTSASTRDELSRRLHADPTCMAVYVRGLKLIKDTQMMAALFAAVHKSLSAGHVAASIDAADLRSTVESTCVDWGLPLVSGEGVDRMRSVPGWSELWATIVAELASNALAAMERAGVPRTPMTLWFRVEEGESRLTFSCLDVPFARTLSPEVPRTEEELVAHAQEMVRRNVVGGGVGSGCGLSMVERIWTMLRPARTLSSQLVPGGGIPVGERSLGITFAWEADP